MLSLDKNTISWIKSLARVSLGDMNGFDFISQEMSISVSEQSLYKALITNDPLYIRNLLEAIEAKTSFPSVLQDELISLLDGDIDSIIEILMSATLTPAAIAKLKAGSFF